MLFHKVPYLPCLVRVYAKSAMTQQVLFNQCVRAFGHSLHSDAGTEPLRTPSRMSRHSRFGRLFMKGRHHGIISSFL